MTTRPTLDTTPEDASLSKWTRDVEKFVEDLTGNEKLPSAPAEVKVASQANSVKVTFRAVNEVGVSEYKIYRGTDKNFTGENSEHIATVTQAIDPSGTDIIYIDAESTEKSYYFVSAVKGVRRPRLEGLVAGFGSATEGHEIGEDTVGGTILGLEGASGSILFMNDVGGVSVDTPNLFYSQSFKVPVAGPAGISWGPHNLPDIFLIRDEADTLALRRGINAQSFRVYENFVATPPNITSTLLLEEIDQVDRTVYTTSSISPGADKLILCAVQAADNGFVGPILVNTVTGAGLTWVKVAEVQYNTIAGPRITHALFRALGSSPSPGTLTITLDGSSAETSWVISEHGGVDTGGTFGSAAVVQFATNATDSDTSIAATLSAFANSANATYGTFAGGGPDSWTPGSGFVEIGENVAPGTLITQAQFRADNSTTVDAFHSGAASDLSVIAIEIKNASQFGNSFLGLNAFGASGEFEVMVNDASGNDRDLVIGTRTEGDIRLFRNDLEQVRITDTSTDLGLNNLAFGSAIGVEDTILVRDGAADTLALKRGDNVQKFRVYETITSAGPKIAPTLLTAGSDENDTIIYTTASITPSADTMIFAWVNSLRFDVAAASNPTVTGNGLTWVLVDDQPYDHAGAGRARVSLFRAVGPAPTSGVVRFTYPEGMLRASWVIAEYSNADISGGGVNAVVQSVTSRFDDGGGETATPSVTLAAFGDPENATLGFTGWGQPAISVTPGTGFAEVGEASEPTGTGTQQQFRNDNDTSVDWTYTGAAESGNIAIELKNVLTGVGSRYLEILGLGASGGAEVMSVTGSGTTDIDLVLGNQGIEVIRLGVSGSAVSSFLHSHAFTSGGGGTSADLHKLSGILTGADEDIVSLFGMDIDPTVVTQTATESIADIASLNIEEPKITDNLTGDITVASTLRIGGAPDEGLTNWSLNVVSGASKFGGDIDIRQADLGAPGQADSDSLTFVGPAFNGAAPNNSEWKIFNNVTNSSGASLFSFAERIDAAAFVTYWTINHLGSVHTGAPGPHSWGSILRSDFRAFFAGTFGSSGAFTTGGLFSISGPLIGGSGFTTALYGMDMVPQIITQTATESIADIATLNLEEPLITDNLTGGGLITVASTLRIAGAPDEGVTNWALNVVVGNSNFGGNILLPAGDLGNDVPGRCVTVERNTHVADEGPAPGSVELESADGTSRFFWADNHGHLRIHTAKPTGSTGTPTVDSETAGFALVEHDTINYHFVSPLAASGIFYVAGFYDAPLADSNLTQASPTQTHGTANHPYYAHAFLVAAAAGTASGGAGEVEIEVSGTSINDNGVRVTSDTEIIVADITAMATDQYFETLKKWIGLVTYTLQVAGGGTHTTFAADFNFGFAKHDDLGNHDFQIQSFELTGRAGATDTDFNVELIHHQLTGWTYSAAAFVPGPPPLVDVASILSTESDLNSGDHFAFKKLDLSTNVNGDTGEEGYLVRVTTSANNAVESMNLEVGVAFN